MLEKGFSALLSRIQSFSSPHVPQISSIHFISHILQYVLRQPQYRLTPQRPPCILNDMSLKIHGMASWLRRLTYTAIFPHYAHFDVVLGTLVEFNALRHLRLQLAPDPNGSRLLDDQEFVGKGNLSLRDCWNEVEKCYEAVVTRLLISPPVDEEGGAGAAQQGGEAMALDGGAGDDDGGAEVRRLPPPLPLLQEFTSEDYRIDAMREVLDDIFKAHAGDEWVKSGPLSWTPVE